MLFPDESGGYAAYVTTQSAPNSDLLFLESVIFPRCSMTNLLYQIYM